MTAVDRLTLTVTVIKLRPQGGGEHKPMRRHLFQHLVLITNQIDP